MKNVRDKQIKERVTFSIFVILVVVLLLINASNNYYLEEIYNNLTELKVEEEFMYNPFCCLDGCFEAEKYLYGELEEPSDLYNACSERCGELEQ